VKAQTSKSNKEIASLTKELQKKYLEKDVFPFLSFVEITEDNSLIDNLIDAVNRKMQRAKLQRPVVYGLLDVQPLQIPEDFSKLKGINAQVPRDKNGKLLDFEEIARLSEGNVKIAALKMKADQNRKGNFDDELLKLITDKGLQQNIHVVYSIGDECFLIGSWNRVFDLVINLRERLKERTFSAGIVVVPPKYPMTRLVEDVEEALNTANSDSVACFGKNVKWSEFKKSQNIAGQLVDLVRNKGESKNLIERIKASDIGISRLQQDASRGRINVPKVWRLKYYLRNIRRQNKEEVEKLFNEYTNAVLDAFMNRQTTNPDLYPLAARWAELLLKK
jgi:CRISPR-associated protein Csm1